MVSFHLFMSNVKCNIQTIYTSLQDIVTSAHFAAVNNGGNAYYNYAPDSGGVRPVFSSNCSFSENKEF